MKIGETIKSSKRNNEILLPYALFADELIPLALFTFSPFAATNPTAILSIAGRISKVSVVYPVAVPCLVDILLLLLLDHEQGRVRNSAQGCTL